MKYLNTWQDRTGKNVSIEGHKHAKNEITDFPTKLSQLTNDTGFTSNALIQTVNASAPTSPISGQVWIQLI